MKTRNPIARDLLTPKYRQRIVKSPKEYNRKKEKNIPKEINLKESENVN